MTGTTTIHQFNTLSLPLPSSILSPAHPALRNTKMSEANLKRCDALCLKIGAAAIIVLSFVCAVGRLSITTDLIGYCLMGILIALAIIRTILFYIMDIKGV